MRYDEGPISQVQSVSEVLLRKNALPVLEGSNPAALTWSSVSGVRRPAHPPH